MRDPRRMVCLSVCLANDQGLRPLYSARSLSQCLRKTLYKPPQRRPQSYGSIMEVIFYIILYSTSIFNLVN
jgi:hypothetical protein